MGFAWVLTAIGVLQFIRQLQVTELDFDGVRWYLADKVGAVSVRFDGQICMLLRFEDDLNQACWLWVETRKIDQQDPERQNLNFNDPENWLALRRAVYSRPETQSQVQNDVPNSPNLI